MGIESKIDELIAALDRNTQAQGFETSEESTAPQSEASGKRGRKPKATQPPAQPATPAATAPAAGLPAQPAVASAPALTQAGVQLLQAATNAVITLANEYSRDQAVAILGKKRGANGERPGVTRCSDLSPLDYQDVLSEASAAVASAESAKKVQANTSLV